MFDWLKKKVLTMAIKNVIKKLPKYKEEASILIKENTDGVLDKVEEAIKKVLESLIAKKANK